MDDQQPPRKKSRFFSNNAPLLNSASQPTAAASASDPNQRQRQPPPPPLNLANNHQLALPQVTIPSSISPYQSQNDPQTSSGSHLAVPQQSAKPSQLTPTASLFEGLTVSVDKTDRRKGVYGARSLFDQIKPIVISQAPQARPLQPPTNSSQYDFGYSQQPGFHHAPPMIASQNAQAMLSGATGQDSASFDSHFRNPDGMINNSRVEEYRRLWAAQHPNQASFSLLPQIILQPNIYQDTGPLSIHRFHTSAPAKPNLTHPLNNRQPPQSYNGNIPNSGVTNLPLHATFTPRQKRSSAPPTHFTSPNRIARAFRFASSKKRKRPGRELPPPAYIYKRSNNPSFNVFQGILLYPELCFHLAAHLPLNDLISLYAISKDYHTILNTRLTTVILSQSLRRAPESSRVFAFRCYGHLCRTDPAARIPHPDPRKAAVKTPRKVPTFRWLKMVLYREKVVHEIMTIMAEDGIPLPRRCGLALKKMWFMLDIPDNARRIGYTHNRLLLSDLDLYFIVCAIVKMDMRFNDPVAPEKRDGVRKLLLAQRSLSFWLRVLKREEWTNRLEVMRDWMRWKYDPFPDAIERGEKIFGVPLAELGRMKLQYWGDKRMEELQQTDQHGNRVLLMRPDQLAVREVVRRGLRCTGHYLKCLLYGYVDPRTLENFQPRNITRQIGEWKGEEYDVDDEVGGARMIEGWEGGDPLLDLGPKKVVSRYCINAEAVTTEEEKKRAAVNDLTNRMMILWGTGIGGK